VSHPDPALEALVLELSEQRGRLEALEAGQETTTADVAALTEKLASLTAEDDSDRYRPAPSPRWWQLEGDARAAEIDRLAAWVEQVYRPGYGHMARSLGACWQEHDLCLYVLDVLAELHTWLYQPARTRAVGRLTSQADWHARLLVPLADLLARETKACSHGLPAGNGDWSSRIGVRQ
jgi:hypothetical protein